MPTRGRPEEQEPRPITLREETLEFLEELRPEDIELWRSSLRLVQSIRTVGKALKWLLITLGTSFIGFATFGDALLKLKAMWLAGFH